MNRRGLTLIELLLSLALLASLLVASAGWTQFALRTANPATESAQREAAVRAVFALIQDDLTCGDFDLTDSPPKVTVVDGTLEVNTRIAGIGPVQRRYFLDSSTGMLKVASDAGASAGLGAGVKAGTGGDGERVLVDSVREFECSIDDQLKTLHVAITLGDSQSHSRRYVLR